MTQYVVYSTSSTAESNKDNILSLLNCPPDQLSNQLQTGQAAVEGTANQKTQYVDTSSGSPVITDKPTTAPTLAEKQAARKKDVAFMRWGLINSGYTWNTYPLATDPASLGNINAAYNRAKDNSNNTEVWKLTNGGWTPTLTASQVISMAQAVGNFVSAAFANEKALDTQIDNSTDPSTVDITTGWPANHN